MNIRTPLIMALTALGLGSALPAAAQSPGQWNGVVMTKQERAEDRAARRDDRRDRRSVAHEDDGGYGTGFERRQSRRDRADSGEHPEERRPQRR